MDYSSQHGLSHFTGRKMMIFLCLFLLLGTSSTQSTTAVSNTEKILENQSSIEASKSEVSKKQEPEAQRREHSFNADGTVNYHGSGSGHDSGDLIPPPGGSVFNTPSIELSTGHTGASGPGLSNSYGLPIPDDSYGPPKNFFNNKPSSFYGPPSQQYGPPNNKYLPPPKPIYGPPKPSFRPPSSQKYNAPSGSQFKPPKSSYISSKPVRSKPNFNSRPRPVYGPPKDDFGTGFSHGTLLTPVTKTQYGPPKISATYGTPLQPSTSYGPPKHPNHGQISAPPTPPVVKYDGWKPISGLVPNAPSSAYGTPNTAGHGISTGHGIDFSSSAQISSSGFGSIAPPSGSYGVPSFGGTSFGTSGFGIQLQPSTSYGPPSKPSVLYGTPLHPSSSYGPPSHQKGSSKVNFLSSFKPPSSSYGLPEPSLAPVPPKPNSSYGPPTASGVSYRVPQISSSYGPPKPPSDSYGPPKPPSSSYGPPSISIGPYELPKPPSSSYGPPKPPSISYGPPKPPSSSYGPPKPPSISYGSPKPPSSSYGPPKPPSSSYGPPKPPSSSYGPPKPPSSSYGPPKPPSISYGPSKPPSSSYGPPKPPSSSYGPPKPPSSSYGPPKFPSSSYGPPQIFTTYTIPKPGITTSVTPTTAYRGPSVPHPLQPPSTYGPPSFQGGLYKTPLPPNALYGVPTAPASGTGVGCCGPVDLSFQFQSNTYGAPFPDLHAPVVPSVDLNSQFLSTGPSPSFPSVIPSTSYGTPITASTPASAHPPASTYGVPTALPLRQPKNPVKFRPPVPAGLISSIGAKWGDSAAWGGSSHSHKFQGNTYIPPAVPDPDPGIQANKGNPLVIPPPSAPPVNYGPPPTSQEVHSQVSNHFVSTVSSHSSGEGSLFPPPPPPPPLLHGQSNFEIQQSASVELPSSNNLDHQVEGNKNQLSAEGVTGYNAPVDSAAYQQSSVSQGFNSGVQSIPIQGTQGSYTLQIQAAGGNSGEHIPHNEVLSNGLLQDILAAIENTSGSEKLEQYGNQQSNDPIASEIGLNILKQLGGTHAQQSNGIQIPTQYGADLSHASSSNVPLYSQNSDTINEVVQIPSNVTKSGSDVKIGKYLSQNRIAFYYNNQEGVEERKGDEKDILLVQMLLPNNSTTPESEKRPVRTNRLEASTVRAAPYPQPTSYNQAPTAAPVNTVQEAEPVASTDCQLQSSKFSEQSAISNDHCHTFVQGKIGTPNVGHLCPQNSTTAPYNTTATIPVIQPSCVLPVEQCIGNGVLTNISSNGNCIPASPCYTTVIPANIVGTNSNACLPVTPRFQTPVVDSSVAITDCRCQAEGSSCCHSAIASYPSTHAPTSMIFVPYSIPNFPPHPRGNLVSSTSPCGGATPVKDTKGSRATSPRTQSKPDTSQHYHIFVGDLSPEIDTQTLRDAFAPFGEISDSRVVRDAQTLKSKGYGFVSFIKKSEAKSAIAAMNGRWLGSRSIRTNWATRKPPLLKADGNLLPLSFDEVYKQSSASNCTVYCGGIINGLSEELVQKIFSPFGTIQEIKVFKDKGYAFVRFSTKESAAHAIVAVHNTEVNGQVVKCSWGKENSDLANVHATAQFDQPIAGATFPYAYGQQMGYWYPQSFPATTTQIPGQYLQSGFSLGQFGYHQDFIGRLSMNLSSIWNGMPGQTQLPTTMQPIGQGTAIQQPSNMVAAYPVQRFQLPEEEWTAPSLLV